MQQKLFLCAAILFSTFLPLQGQVDFPAFPQFARNETELRNQAFNLVWDIVNERHFDPTFGGVDWAKMREIYKPKALAAKTLDDFHKVLLEMVGELKVSHYSIYLPSVDDKDRSGIIGVELKMIDGLPVIFRIAKDSPADKAGLKPGFVIEKIDDKKTADILAEREKIWDATKFIERKRIHARQVFFQNLIDGKPEIVLRLEVLNNKNQLKSIEITRVYEESSLRDVTNGVARNLKFDSRRLNAKIGYISFSFWSSLLTPQIRQAIHEFIDTKGIIIDLRGNPGGFPSMTRDIAGFFFNEEISLGSTQSRSGKTELLIKKQPEIFQGKIVILTDYGTSSASELFAAGMQENNRAKIVGVKSKGAVLPSKTFPLPTGRIFQYPFSDYKSPRQNMIEGVGVNLDIEVKLTREGLMNGRDTQLEAAVKSITD